MLLQLHTNSLRCPEGSFHLDIIYSALPQTHEPLENGFSSDFSQHYCAGTTATSVERDSTVINQFRAGTPILHMVPHISMT